jgi:hypothetical protein
MIGRHIGFELDVMRSEFSEWKNQNIKSIKKCG